MGMIAYRDDIVKSCTSNSSIILDLCWKFPPSFPFDLLCGELDKALAFRISGHLKKPFYPGTSQHLINKIIPGYM
jgi:hypothetical protein